MKTRLLGRTGLAVSEIGFGAWGIGGTLWIGARDEESLAALHRALDLGVNLIDTAIVYGQGRSRPCPSWPCASASRTMRSRP